MPERNCDLLISDGARTVVEVGLAYASSALAIGEALVTLDPPHARHIIIDPFQESAWSNVGWDLLCAAGLDSIATLNDHGRRRAQRQFGNPLQGPTAADRPG